MRIYKLEIHNAPCEPECPIERRRWWNQIVINAISKGIMTGCYYIKNMSGCTGPCGIVDIFRNKCDIEEHIIDNSQSAFIGF